MSGKPSSAGATKLIELLDQLRDCDLEIEALERSVARLKQERELRATVAREAHELVEKMDVASEGNYGYGLRTLWLVAEVIRQVRK